VLLGWRTQSAGALTVCMIELCVYVQVSVEATHEHPFFVIGQGWSSHDPLRTRQLYNLPCSRLQVGDVCISLTHRDTIATNSSTAGSAQYLADGECVTDGTVAAGESRSTTETTSSTSPETKPPVDTTTAQQPKRARVSSTSL
jgi:hypothetical protein